MNWKVCKNILIGATASVACSSFFCVQAHAEEDLVDTEAVTVVEATNPTTEGWAQKEDGDYYQYADGSFASGIVNIDGLQYYFNEKGCLQKETWITVNEAFYYATADGTLATGETVIDGIPYLFGLNGREQLGWQTVDQKRYYYDEYTGAFTEGWISYRGSRYYTSLETGKISGEQSIDNTIYDFKEEYGYQNTGWVTHADKTQSYYAEDGTIATGLQPIDQTQYYFDETGIMQTGWQELDGQKYYFGETGAMQTGWQVVENYKYHFSDTGVMTVSTTLDGFVIGADGKAITSLKNRMNAITNSYTTPDKIYSYMVNHFWYKYNEATKTYAQIASIGWDKYAEYILNNRCGVCYYLAACMDYMLQNAGYTTRMIHATHSSGDHYWNQVYVDGAWLNYDPTYTNRGNIGWNAIINAGAYRILGYVTVSYNPYTGEYLGSTQE